jgi:predicted RNA-binding Zn-ribbon protein involved in translation (DUF1610 family)
MRGFKKQLNRFEQICPRFFNRIALACNVQFSAKRDKTVFFAPNCGS